MAVTTSGKDKVLRWTRIYVSGYDLSGDARTFGSLDNSFAEVDFTGWSEAVRNYLADGHRVVGVRGFQALMNDTSGRAFDRLKAANTAGRLSICFGGGGEPSAGDPAYHLPSIQMMAPQGLDGSAAAITADFIPDARQVSTLTDNPMGVVLRGPTSMSSTVTASSSNSHDNGGATTSGWSAILHVLSTSSGNFAFKIRHSSDDSSWSDLGTFTANGSAVTSELLTGSGTVNRYVAFNAARTAGTVTVVVTFARNLVLNS